MNNQKEQLENVNKQKSNFDTVIMVKQNNFDVVVVVYSF